jgi:adenylate cyclase
MLQVPMNTLKLDGKILIIDDSRTARGVIRKILESLDFLNVDEAGGGAVGLEMMKSAEYDLVLLDMVMEGMDGVDTLRRIKGNNRLHNVPVLILSGTSDDALVAKCIEIGAVDYLPKKFNREIFKARVSSCLAAKQLRDLEIKYLEQIKFEKKRADQLLNIILPGVISDELKATGCVRPRRHDNVATLFCDIVSFTKYSKEHRPEEVVEKLQILFGAFEKAVANHKMEKIKTIGDAFMATAGLLAPVDNPIETAVDCAFSMLEAVETHDIGWDIRIGINQGEVVAGVVGMDRYQFDIWGDSVNVASRMCDMANPHSIFMPYSCSLHVPSKYDGEIVGACDVKGLGPTQIVKYAA